MALEVHDRVKETTTTTGSSDAYALGGAVTGFETFGSHLGDADTTYYVCTDGTNFEIGIGTYNNSANTLTRTTILASSNSGNDNAHSWAAGTKEIFITYPSSKAVFKDASNNINGTFVGNITGDVTGNADTATALENARAINGVSFNGTGDITVTAAAGTLSGDTLKSTVTASSLTSLGTLASDLNVGGQDIINAGVSSADTHAGIYGSSSAPVEFTVTVGSKTAAHPYYGDGSSSAYFINGVESPALTLHGVDNVTSNSEYYYRFTLSSSDMSSHPFRLYLDADKTTAYTTGVTTTSTYLQIAVNEDTPNILYYQCSSHAYMGNHAIVLGSNKINHTEALISFPTTTGTLVGTGDTGSVSNTMLGGSIANSKLANSSINFGGVSLALGASDTTPAFDLSDATAYPTSSLVGTITNAQLAGSIANSKLANDSVSFGGISLDLGESDATPAFNLSDATNYPTSSLSGTITNAQLAGSIANAKLANSSITVADASSSTAIALGGTLTFSGTSNEVEVGESSGTITIGLPSAITANVTGNLTGNADTATKVYVDESEDDNLFYNIIFENTHPAGNGYSSMQVDDNGLQFNPGTNTLSTGVLNATTLTGTLSTAAQGNVTSLGTLTTLTVDNVIINGSNIGHTGDTDLITVASGVMTVAGEVDATSLDISGDADIDGTLEADAITVNGTALNTVIADEATALAIALG